MSSTSRVLFVPVSGPTGSGEVERCRVLAAGLSEEDPEIVSAFVLSREAPLAVDPFVAFRTAKSPTFCTAEMHAIVDRFRPDVVVFDNAGRTAQLRHARARSARVVFVSRTPGKRAKAFRPQWLSALSEHWVLFAGSGGPRLTRAERLANRWFGPVTVRSFGALFRPSAAAEREQVLQRHDLTRGGYVLYTLGGGPAATAAASVFVEAARRVGAAGGIRHVVLSGRGDGVTNRPAPWIEELPRVPADQVTCLIHDAAAVVSNGGSTMFQVLAHDRPAIAIPVRDDQHLRVRTHAAAGTVVAAELDPDGLAAKVLRLLGDPEEVERLRRARERHPVRNGFEEAIAALVVLARSPHESARD